MLRAPCAGSLQPRQGQRSRWLPAPQRGPGRSRPPWPPSRRQGGGEAPALGPDRLLWWMRGSSFSLGSPGLSRALLPADPVVPVEGGPSSSETHLRVLNCFGSGFFPSD